MGVTINSKLETDFWKIPVSNFLGSGVPRAFRVEWATSNGLKGNNETRSHHSQELGEAMKM